MSVTINIPTALRHFTGGNAQVEVEAGTAGEALDLLTSYTAALRRHLFNDQTPCATSSTSISTTKTFVTLRA